MKHQAIVDACKKAFMGFDRNDKSDLIALLADDFVFDFTVSPLHDGTNLGKKESLEHQGKVHQLWECFRYDARAILATEDFVIVSVIAHPKATNGDPVGNEQEFLFQVRDGKIIDGRLYASDTPEIDLIQGCDSRRSRKVVMD